MWKITTVKQNILLISKLITRENSQSLLLLLLLLLLLSLVNFSGITYTIKIT